MRLLGEHLTNAEIAARLYISERTVEVARLVAAAQARARPTGVSSLAARSPTQPRRRRRARRCRRPSSCSPTRTRFVGRAAERERAPRAMGASPSPGTRCWSSSPARPGWARAGSCRSWPSRCTPGAAVCCSGRATRTSTSRTVRSSRRSSTTPPTSTPPSLRRAGDTAAPSPELARLLPAHGPRLRRRRRVRAQRGARRHPPLARQSAPSSPLLARGRGPPLVDVDHPGRAAPPRPPGQPGAAADRRHRPRLQAGPRRRSGDAARRPRTLPDGQPRSPCAGSTATRSPSSSAPDRAAEAELILAETRGNPLLVTHLTSDVRHGTLPVWLYQRDQLLDDEARAVLDQAATFGAEFDADLLAAAHGAPLLDRARVAGGRRGGRARPAAPSARPAGFAFVHALFRSLPVPGAAAAPPARAARPGGRRAGHPARRRAAGRRSAPATPAWPCRSATPELAVALSQQAARRDEHAYAYDEAVAHYRRGLDAARSLDPPDPGTVLDLTIRIGAALHHRGDPRGLPMLLDAAERARDQGDTAALVRAATAIPQFGAVGFVDPMPEGRAVTEAALAALGDDADAGARPACWWTSPRTGCSSTSTRRSSWPAEPRRSPATSADPEVLGAVLLSARHLFSHPARIDERVRIGAELERLGRQLDRLAFSLAGVATQAAAAPRTRRARRVDARASIGSSGSSASAASASSSCRPSTTWPSGRSSPATSPGPRSWPTVTVPLSVGIGAGRVYADGIVVANRRSAGTRRGGARPATNEPRRARRDAWYRCSLAAVQARTGRIDDARATLRCASATRASRSGRSTRGRSP